VGATADLLSLLEIKRNKLTRMPSLPGIVKCCRLDCIPSGALVVSDRLAAKRITTAAPAKFKPHAGPETAVSDLRYQG